MFYILVLKSQLYDSNAEARFLSNDHNQLKLEITIGDTTAYYTGKEMEMIKEEEMPKSFHFKMY